MKRILLSKLAKIRYVCLALAFVGMMSACSDDETLSVNNEPTPEELAEMAAVDKFAAANSVYRALGLLNELPENWEGTNFTPEVGVKVLTLLPKWVYLWMKPIPIYAMWLRRAQSMQKNIS